MSRSKLCILYSRQSLSNLLYEDFILHKGFKYGNWGRDEGEILWLYSGLKELFANFFFPIKFKRLPLFFYKHCVFWGISLGMLSIFSFMLFITLTICLLSRSWTNCNIRGSIRIRYSKNVELAIQWYSLKYDHALIAHPSVKVRISYRLPLCRHS